MRSRSGGPRDATSRPTSAARFRAGATDNGVRSGSLKCVMLLGGNLANRSLAINRRGCHYTGRAAACGIEWYFNVSNHLTFMSCYSFINHSGVHFGSTASWGSTNDY